MKKILLSMASVRAFPLILCLFSVVLLRGQVAGDYGSRNASGTYGTATDWLVFVSAADWSDATVVGALTLRSGNLTLGSNTSIEAAYASNTWTVTGYTGSFSPFVAGVASSLAVEMTAVSASNKGNINTINFTTASEKDLKGFQARTAPQDVQPLIF